MSDDGEKSPRVSNTVTYVGESVGSTLGGRVAVHSSISGLHYLDLRVEDLADSPDVTVFQDDVLGYDEIHFADGRVVRVDKVFTAEAFGDQTGRPGQLMGRSGAIESPDAVLAIGKVTPAETDHIDWSDVSFAVVRQPRIELPPGSTMLAIAETVFSPETKERVFDQIVADFREEYGAAAREAGRARMFFLVTRHWAGFILAVILEAAAAIGRVIKAVKGAS